MQVPIALDLCACHSVHCARPLPRRTTKESAMADQTPPPIPGSAPSSNRTIMIVLSYLGILALIPLLVEKDDKEVQWHAKHGLVLLVAEIALFVGLSILQAIIAQVPVIGCLGAIIGFLIWTVLMIGILVLHVICIVKGVNGQRFMLPYVSEYANRF
jgi:uncharacterized membrane protein